MHDEAAFLTALARAKGLDTIVSVGHRLLGNPIIVSDKSWKAIAIASDEKESDDEGFNEFLTDGALSFDTVSINIKDKLTDRIEKSEKPFVYKEANMKYRRLFSKVIIGARPVATVSVIECTRPFKDEDFDRVTMLSNALSAEMQKNKFMHYTRGLLYEEFIVELIEGRFQSSELIQKREKSLNLGMKKYIYVLTVDIKGFDVQQFSVTYMRDYLERMLPGSKALIYSDSITIVASYAHENDLYDSDIEKLSVFLREYGIKCGVSRGFSELKRLREHYEQSLEALRLGEHMDSEESVYSYGDYAIYHIARICSEHGDLKSLCHPKLETLMKYDKEHKTAFTDSLYIYLRRSRNITNTAKALHLHRNSMIYHLKRIEEILGFSLHNNDMLLHIELSFRLMEYDKKFDRARDLSRSAD